MQLTLIDLAKLFHDLSNDIHWENVLTSIDDLCATNEVNPENDNYWINFRNRARVDRYLSKVKI